MALAPRDEMQIFIDLWYYDFLKAKPKELTIFHSQQLLFEDYVDFWSAYTTDSLATTLQFDEGIKSRHSHQIRVAVLIWIPLKCV